MAKKFFTGLIIAAQVAERLFPFVKKHVQEGKTPLKGWRRKYKGAATVARFVYRRGLNKGKRQGKQQEREDIARRLLKTGLEPATVCKITGLTRQEVEQLGGKTGN